MHTLQAWVDTWHDKIRVECRKNKTSFPGGHGSGCGEAELRGCAVWRGCQPGSFLKTILRRVPGCCRPAVISYTATFADLNGVIMRFTLLDRVTAIEPGKSITAIKTLSLSEEYLADHFPCFPVMPGVLMLESMTQAAAWAIRLGEDFAHSIVVLREARNVKYGDFVEPGKVLTVTAEIQSQDGPFVKVKASGKVGERTSLTARLVLERYNMSGRIPYGDAVDTRVRAEMRKLWSILHPASRPLDGGRRVAYGVPRAMQAQDSGVSGSGVSGSGDSGLRGSPAAAGR